MKPLISGLLVSFLSAQAVSLADCCCGSFCQHKNTCTGCKSGDACPGGERAPEKPSCCGEDGTAPKKTCSHLEPSSEIDRVAADTPQAPPLMVFDLVPIHLYGVCHEEQGTPAIDTGPPRAGPQDALPRHLYLSVLRI